LILFLKILDFLVIDGVISNVYINSKKVDTVSASQCSDASIINHNIQLCNTLVLNISPTFVSSFIGISKSNVTVDFPNIPCSSSSIVDFFSIPSSSGVIRKSLYYIQ